MAAYASRGGSVNKHGFADTEIEIATKTRFFWGIVLSGHHWEIRVVATMRPRRPLNRFWRKTATDTADRIVLQVHFPLSEGEDLVITDSRSRGSVSAMRSYSTNPWDKPGRGWRIWRKRQCLIRYSTQVEYLGNPYTFSGELEVFEPWTE